MHICYTVLSNRLGVDVKKGKIFLCECAKRCFRCSRGDKWASCTFSLTSCHLLLFHPPWAFNTRFNYKCNGKKHFCCLSWHHHVVNQNEIHLSFLFSQYTVIQDFSSVNFYAQNPNLYFSVHTNDQKRVAIASLTPPFAIILFFKLHSLNPMKQTNIVCLTRRGGQCVVWN